MAGAWRIATCLFGAVTMSGAAAPECAPGGNCPAHDDNDFAEAALLQSKVTRATSHRKGLRWWGQPAPAPQDKHFVQFDTPKKMPVPREVVDSGFVRELIIKFPLKTNPIKIVGNSAHLDMAKMLEGRFSRDPLKSVDEYRDYGIEKAVVFIGQRSVISDRVKLAFAEKSHTLWMPKKTAAYSSEKEEQVEKSQTSWEKTEAVARRAERHSALSGLSMFSAPQIIMGGKDQQQLDELRNYTKSHRKPSKSTMKDYQNANVELQTRQAQRTATEPIRSSIGCLHFEDAELMNFTADTVQVPLDTKIVGWRGQLGSYPNKWYGMSSGTTLFIHNEEEDSFDIYFQFSSAVTIMDHKEDYTAWFDVGPADGSKMKVASYDGRHESNNDPSKAINMWNTAKSIPIDFSFLHSKRQDVGCPDEVLDTFPTRVAQFQNLFSGDMLHMMWAMPTMMSGWYTLMDEVNCAVEYLRPMRKDQVVSYGRIEAVGLLHVLMEMPGEIMVAAFQNSTQWNTFSLL